MPSSADNDIKKPNVSGQFYADDPSELSVQIKQFKTLAQTAPYDRHIDIIIAPHAGYIYSGSVAAHSFKAASQKQYNTIVILAPSHFYGFDGISIWDKGGFETPLGVIAVDESFAKKLTASNDSFYFDPKAYHQEHSLEVEIPFLQETFTNFKIVPVIFGQPGFEVLEKFSKALKDIIADRDDVLIVVSTDLSHYHDDQTARKMDKQAISAIKDLDAQSVYKKCMTKEMEMCGFIPVTAALLYAQLKELGSVDILNYANSGTVNNDLSSVVGYTSIAIYGGEAVVGKEDSELNLSQKKRLLQIARKTVDEIVKDGKALELNEEDQRLYEQEGVFVTIHNKEELRGCIGRIVSSVPLYQLVRDMAVASATDDPRFSPVKSEELSDIDVEVSVLSKPKVIKDVDEIQMGVHGVIITKGNRSGVFLPQVADSTGWGKEEFLTQLCSQKAGLPGDCWKDPGTKIEIFTANVFSEKDVDQ